MASLQANFTCELHLYCVLLHFSVLLSFSAVYYSFISTRSPCRTSIAYSGTGIFLMSSSGIPGRNVSEMALRPCELSSSISCQWILPGQHTSRGTPAEMHTTQTVTVCQALLVHAAILLRCVLLSKSLQGRTGRRPFTGHQLCRTCSGFSS